MDVRVAAFVDGFNLYHALDTRKLQDCKWLDLRKLCEVFAPAPQHDVVSVFYFSAFATWRVDAYHRHRQYVKALVSCGVTPVLGRFKEKDRECRQCGSRWQSHEEKETDVNIALYLMRQAFLDTYDRALLVSGDSDLSPAVTMVRELFPNKSVRVLTPFGRSHSMDLVNAAGGVTSARRILQEHLERSLLPMRVLGSGGELVAERPEKYSPPE